MQGTTNVKAGVPGPRVDPVKGDVSLLLGASLLGRMAHARRAEVAMSKARYPLWRPKPTR
ncbi:MAG TPA: hypothetical protein VLC95_11265 [Anaerolineae bacterium]|nr:hypothetical protein [Anaerolineae bacterium]